MRSRSRRRSIFIAGFTSAQRSVLSQVSKTGRSPAFDSTDLRAGSRLPMSNLGRTTPPEWRLFIALGLPAALRTALTHEQERLQAAGLHAAWVRPPGMHLTLHFLGDMPVTALERVEAACVQAATGIPPLRLRAAGLRCFPSAPPAARPRHKRLGRRAAVEAPPPTAGPAAKSLGSSPRQPALPPTRHHRSVPPAAPRRAARRPAAGTRRAASVLRRVCRRRGSAISQRAAPRRRGLYVAGHGCTARPADSASLPG